MQRLCDNVHSYIVLMAAAAACSREEQTALVSEQSHLLTVLQSIASGEL